MGSWVRASMIILMFLFIMTPHGNVEGESVVFYNRLMFFEGSGFEKRLIHTPVAQFDDNPNCDTVFKGVNIVVSGVEVDGLFLIVSQNEEIEYNNNPESYIGELDNASEVNGIILEPNRGPGGFKLEHPYLWGDPDYLEVIIHYTGDLSTSARVSVHFLQIFDQPEYLCSPPESLASRVIITILALLSFIIIIIVNIMPNPLEKRMFRSWKDSRKDRDKSLYPDQGEKVYTPAQIKRYRRKKAIVTAIELSVLLLLYAVLILVPRR